MSVKVSIIVPVYKVEKYIHRCVDSILAQTFADFECILVDDCSPDNCSQICDEYAARDTRVKVIHKPQNESQPRARRTGFENSYGDYIQFVDSDDWIEPDMTEKLYGAAIASDADIVACDYFINENKNYRYVIQNIDTENHFNNLGFVNSAAVWNKFYHRRIIKLIEFPNIGRYEDRVTTQQALFYAKKIIKISYPLYHYCDNPDSVTKIINVPMYRKRRTNILSAVDFLRKNLGDKFALKEENVNDCINKFKFKALKSGLFLKDKSLLFFYPESKFIRWFLLRVIKEVFLLIIPHGFFILLAKQNKDDYSSG